MTYMRTGESGRRIRNISELAKLAGVSAGTVSRALAGKDLVNRQTRERIQELAREHGFRPNQMASRLRTGHTGVIGMVVPVDGAGPSLLGDPFFMTLFGHLADAVAERGHDLMLNRVTIDGQPDWLERVTDSGMLDGVLMTRWSDQCETIDRVAGEYAPLVVWGWHQPGQAHCSVGSDSRAGGYKAATHLLAQGRRKLAFFGDVAAPEIARRLEGAQAAVAESGNGATIQHLPTSSAVGHDPSGVAEHLEQLAPSTDGILAGTDVIAMSVLRGLHERGCMVPDDIAVVGYGDLPIGLHSVPRLTTVRQDLEAGAKAMVDSLFRRMAGEDVGPTMMDPEVVVRESA